MILLIDLGNSRLKWTSWRPGGRVEGVAVPWRGLDIHEVLDRSWGTISRPQRVLLVSVAAPGADAAIASWCRVRWGLAVEGVASQAEAHGVVNGYLDPARLGADRWVALIGARRRCEGACCVIDCGTAITVDALDARGQHQGGLIMPGLALMHSALLQGTAGLATPRDHTREVFARTTRDGMGAGILHAALGGIQRVVGTMDARLGGSTVRLLTGGDMPLLKPMLGRSYREVPHLVLEGLAVIAQGSADACRDR